MQIMFIFKHYFTHYFKMYFDDAMTLDDAMKKMAKIQRCYTDRIIKLSGGMVRKKKTSELHKHYVPTYSSCGAMTRTTGSPCAKAGFVEFGGLCPLHGRNLNNREQESDMTRQIVNRKNPCHIAFIDDDNPDIVVEDAGGRVGVAELEIQGLFTEDYKQWKPEMGASAIVWMKMRPNEFSELAWKNRSSCSLVKLESPTLADYLWHREVKKLDSVIGTGYTYQVNYQKFRVEESEHYEDVIPLDGVVGSCSA